MRCPDCDTLATQPCPAHYASHNQEDDVDTEISALRERLHRATTLLYEIAQLPEVAANVNGNLEERPHPTIVEFVRRTLAQLTETQRIMDGNCLSMRAEWEAMRGAIHNAWNSLQSGEKSTALEYLRAAFNGQPPPPDYLKKANEELAARLAQAERERDALKAALEEREHDMHMRIRAGYDKTVADCWRARVSELEGVLTKLERQTRDHDFLPDHACAECVPTGEIIVPGFQCGRHAAKRVLSSPGSRKEGA